MYKQKEDEFVTRALAAGKSNAKLIRAWYRGLHSRKRNLTPNGVLLAEYPNN